MIEKPEHHIRAFAEAGADLITFHLEAAVHVHRMISAIRDSGRKAGISIVPSTPVSLVTEILAELDLILVMSVNPGYGGQQFIHQSLEKISLLNKMRTEGGHGYRISVDGGIDRSTASLVRNAGADVLVTGSSFFSASDPKEEVAVLRGGGET
jgi:ribulose-phosphate 3-epimerase